VAFKRLVKCLLQAPFAKTVSKSVSTLSNQPLPELFTGGFWFDWPGGISIEHPRKHQNVYR
jgi:hypothetical protein